MFEFASDVWARGYKHAIIASQMSLQLRAFGRRSTADRVVPSVWFAQQHATKAIAISHKTRAQRLTIALKRDYGRSLCSSLMAMQLHLMTNHLWSNTALLEHYCLIEEITNQNEFCEEQKLL